MTELLGELLSQTYAEDTVPLAPFAIGIEAHDALFDWAEWAIRKN